MERDALQDHIDKTNDEIIRLAKLERIADKALREATARRMRERLNQMHDEMEHTASEMRDDPDMPRYLLLSTEQAVNDVDKIRRQAFERDKAKDGREKVKGNDDLERYTAAAAKEFEQKYLIPFECSGGDHPDALRNAQEKGIEARHYARALGRDLRMSREPKQIDRDDERER